MTAHLFSSKGMNARPFRRFSTAHMLAVSYALFGAGSVHAGQLSGIGVPWQEHVVLFHGIASGSWHNKSLERYLIRQGYDVINVDYPSTKYPLETLINMEREVVRTKLEGKKGAVHFVGHSMGGLIIRGILKHDKPKELGRVVMIGTPNHGSELADLLKNAILYKLLLGPAGQQLTTDQAHSKEWLGAPDYRFGVIAGVTPIDISLIGPLVIPGQDDGMVGVESAKLDGMDDFIVMNNAAHVLQTKSTRIQKLIGHYLKYGTFVENPPDASPPPK